MIKILLFISFIFCFNEFEKISDYNIYKGNPHFLQTTDFYTPYELITPLFSDYAWKHRAVYIPRGKKIIYDEKESFKFPIGTIIVKTFYYPHDFNNLDASNNSKPGYKDGLDYH